MEQTATQTNTENAKKPKMDIPQQVTDIIVRQLQAGTIPWQQSWKSNQKPLQTPLNFITGNHYRGINIVLLWSSALDKQYTSNEWASLKQWGGKGEYIRKGENGSKILFTKTLEKEVDGEIKKIPFLTYSHVFNRCQLANYNPSEIVETETKPLFNRLEKVEDFIANTFAQIEHHEGDAFYNYDKDKIYIPHPENFVDTKNCSASENYYSVLFHELSHWTGHPSRLDRKIQNKFGNDAYAKEELVAEFSSSFLTAEFEITAPEIPDHAAYIAHWLKVLQNNKQFIISAASDASKAVEYMKEKQPLRLVL